jgi:hypothetical protein
MQIVDTLALSVRLRAPEFELMSSREASRHQGRQNPMPAATRTVHPTARQEMEKSGAKFK